MGETAPGSPTVSLSLAAVAGEPWQPAPGLPRRERGVRTVASAWRTRRGPHVRGLHGNDNNNMSASMLVLVFK